MSWAVMLRLAVERLGVTPEVFWRLSLKEWRMLTGAPEPMAMNRHELERLAARWPDAPARHPGRSEAESRDLNADGGFELRPRTASRPG